MGSTKLLIKKAERTPFAVGLGRTQAKYSVQVKIPGTKRWTELTDEHGQYEFDCAKERNAFYGHVLTNYSHMYKAVI